MGKIIFSTLAFSLIIFFWSLVTPIFEFPDEQAHIASINYLFHQGEMPQDKDRRLSKELKTTIVTTDLSYEISEAEKYLGTFRDQSGNNKLTYHPEYRPDYTNSLYGKFEQDIVMLNVPANKTNYVGEEAARYPRLYYDYLTIWYRLVDSGDIFARLSVVRIANVGLALLTVFVVFKLGLLLFAKKSYALTLSLLVMLQPMYSFLSAGVNSDNLHNLLFALVIFCGVKILKNGLSTKILLGISLVIVLDIFTKPQGYVAIPIILLAVLLHIIKTGKWKLLWSLATLVIISSLVILSPRNPFGSWINPGNLHNANFIEFARFSLNKLVAQNIVWYWGVFKWLGVVLPPIYWQVANRVVLVGAFGLLIYIWRVISKKKLSTSPYITLFLLLTVIVYTSSIYYFDWQYTKSVGYSIGVQARYFFPTISAQMALIMIGILSLGWNANIRIWLRRGLVIFIVWIQIGGMWRLLSSYYDLTSISSFITQASQYKPAFAKGDWWYLWGGLYIASILYLTWIGMVGVKDKKSFLDRRKV